MAMQSIFVEGIPPLINRTLPIKFREGPINMPDITPPMTPPKSPKVMGTVAAIFCEGIHIIKCLGFGGIAMGFIPMLGYGIGIGPIGGGGGVKHTSGIAKSIPIIEQFKNIISSYNAVKM